MSEDETLNVQLVYSEDIQMRAAVILEKTRLCDIFFLSHIKMRYENNKENPVYPVCSHQLVNKSTIYHELHVPSRQRTFFRV